MRKEDKREVEIKIEGGRREKERGDKENEGGR